MLGDMDNPGVLPYSLHDLFIEMENVNFEYLLVFFF